MYVFPRDEVFGDEEDYVTPFANPGRSPRRSLAGSFRGTILEYPIGEQDDSKEWLLGVDREPMNGPRVDVAATGMN